MPSRQLVDVGATPTTGATVVPALGGCNLTFSTLMACSRRRLKIYEFQRVTR